MLQKSTKVLLETSWGPPGKQQLKWLFVYT